MVKKMFRDGLLLIWLFLWWTLTSLHKIVTKVGIRHHGETLPYGQPLSSHGRVELEAKKRDCEVFKVFQAQYRSIGGML